MSLLPLLSSRCDSCTAPIEHKHFVSCQVTQNSGEGFPEEDTDRGTLGRLTAAYLSEHLDFEDVMVRFDIVSLLVVGDSATISTRSARPSRKPPWGASAPGASPA